VEYGQSSDLVKCFLYGLEVNNNTYEMKAEAKEVIKRELLHLLKEDPKFKFEVFEILSATFVTKEEILRVLDAIESLREDFNIRFEEHSRILEGHSKILEEHSIAIKELTKRVEEHSKVLEGHSKVLEGHSIAIKELTKRIEKLEVTVSAVGSRWGVLAESAFRQALRGLFEERFGVKVCEWITEDMEGYVFGHPSIVQMDVVVKNGEHWLIEIKSSASRGDVTTLHRMGVLYEKEKGIKPAKLILVSPFVDDNAKAIASSLNIDIFTSLV
jgi:hypothetical protein